MSKPQFAQGDSKGRAAARAKDHDTRAVVILARAPQLGRVKTRLSRALGETAALEIYRELGTAVAGAARRLAPCLAVVAFTPPDQGGLMREWLGGDLVFEPQVTGDLGDRMLGALSARFAAGADRAILVGTDCPDLDPPLLERAFAELAGADVVVGPALDGGYYLIGMKRPIAEVFRDVPWSSKATLSVTLARARSAGLAVALLDERRDIDTAEDWRAWQADRRAGEAAHSGGSRSPKGG